MKEFKLVYITSSSVSSLVGKLVVWCEKLCKKKICLMKEAEAQDYVSGGCLGKQIFG